MNQEWKRIDIESDLIQNDVLTFSIKLNPNEYIRSMFVDYLQSFESWSIENDTLGVLTNQDDVQIYAETTIPAAKFNCYLKLISAGKQILHLIDPGFPVDHYRNLKQKIGSDLPILNSHWHYDNDFSYSTEDFKLDKIKFMDIDEYSELIFKTLHDKIYVKINKPTYEKVPVLWIQVVSQNI